MAEFGTLGEFRNVDVTLAEEGVMLDEEVELDKGVCEYTLILH
jgi:hypothetical protein